MGDLFSRLARRVMAERRTVRPQTATVFAATPNVTEPNEATTVPARAPAAPVTTSTERHAVAQSAVPQARHDTEKAAPKPPEAAAHIAPHTDTLPKRPGSQEAPPVRVEATPKPVEPPPLATVDTPAEQLIKVRAEPVVEGAATKPQTAPAVARTELRTTVLQPQLVRTAERSQPNDPTIRRESGPQAAPVIEVTIGQIELRTPPASAPRRRPERKPALSLEAYAAERKEGRR